MSSINFRNLIKDNKYNYYQQICSQEIRSSMFSSYYNVFLKKFSLQLIHLYKLPQNVYLSMCGIEFEKVLTEVNLATT